MTDRTRIQAEELPSPSQLDRDAQGAGRAMRPGVKSPEDFWALLGRVLPCAAAVVLLILCVVSSPKKSAWMDEVFSLLLLRDPSFRHMWEAVRSGVDGGMPPYYLTAYLWGMIFGRSLLSFRFFSALGFGGAILILWRTLARRYSAPAVAIGLLAIVIDSWLIVNQVAEARFYGMYALAATCVIAAQSRFEHDRWTRRDGIALFLAHLFLIYSHPLGIVYSAAALVALVAWDKHRGKLRVRLYGCAAASWLALLLWLPTMIRVSDLTRPHNWMPRPAVNTIVDFFNFSSTSFQFAILAGFVLLLFTKLRPRKSVHGITLYLALAFLLVPVAMAVKSRLGVAVFDPRYFIPTVLAAGAVVAAALDYIGLSPATMTLCTSEMWGLLAGFLLVYPLALAIGSPRLESPYVRLDRIFAGNIPVITEDLNRFLPLTFYRRPDSPQYYYPLDWQEASKSSTLDATVHYKIILRWKQNGYLADNVLSSDEIMCRFNRFIVLDNPEMSWFKDRIENNPDFDVRPGVQLPPMPYPGPIREWLVTRKSPANCAGQAGPPQ